MITLTGRHALCLVLQKRGHTTTASGGIVNGGSLQAATHRAQTAKPLKAALFSQRWSSLRCTTFVIPANPASAILWVRMAGNSLASGRLSWHNSSNTGSPQRDAISSASGAMLGTTQKQPHPLVDASFQGFGKGPCSIWSYFKIMSPLHRMTPGC